MAGFERFCKRIGLELEPFQRKIARLIFAGVRELVVLLPRGNGKTTLFAALALYHVETVEDPKVYLAASSVDQASIAFETIIEFIRRDPALSARFVPKRGYKEIQTRDKGMVLKVISSDADRAHGLQPTFMLVDELHAHRKIDLYVAMRTALGKRTNSQLVTISTAGYDEDGALGKLRAAAYQLATTTRGALTTAKSANGKFAMLEWACGPNDDLTSAKVVKRANPASFVTEDFLQEQIDSPGLPEFEFARYHANVWTAAAASWLPQGAWEACEDTRATIPNGADVYLGIDMGRFQDSAAVVTVAPEGDRFVVKAKVWRPAGDPIPYEVVEDEIRDQAMTYRVVEAAYDPWRFDRSAELLIDEGIPMVQFPMSNERVVPASNDLYEAICAGELAHDGDPILAAHIAAGATKDTERGWRLVKREGRRKQIDALMALVIAFARASAGESTSVYEEREMLVI